MTNKETTIWILAAIAVLMVAIASGCTSTGNTTIPANITLHVDQLTINVPPGAVNAPITITINGRLLAPSPATQPAKESK